MRHVWLVPRPGRLVAFVWTVMEFRRFLLGGMTAESEAALGRYALVVDPASGDEKVDGLAAGFDAIDRLAHRRFRHARAAAIAFCTTPAAIPLGLVLDGDPTPVFGVLIACLLMAISAVTMTKSGAMRIAEEIRELDAPGVLRSRQVAEAPELVVAIEASSGWSAVSRRRLLDLLWRIACTERERREYLDTVEVLDHDRLRRFGDTISSAVEEANAMREASRA